MAKTSPKTRMNATLHNSATPGHWRPMPEPTFWRSSQARIRKPRFWWQTVPGWMRWCLLILVAAIALCALIWTWQTLTALAVVGGASGRYALVRRARNKTRDHLFEGVQALLGLPPGYYDASDWVRLPRDLAHPDAVVRIELPAHFNGANGVKEQIAQAVDVILPGKWEATWRTRFTELPLAWWRRVLLGQVRHETPHVAFHHPPEPPDMVSFTELRARFEAGPENLVPLGKTTRGGLLEVDLDGESPHIAYSGGTGAGKSTFLRSVISYLLRHGAEHVDIVDPKRISLTKPYKGHPRVTIHRELEDQWKAIAEVHAEMEARYRWAEQQDDEEAAIASFRRRVLVIEEGGSFFDMTRAHWKNVRTKDDPTEPPAITKLRHIQFQGRQAKITVLLVVQQGNARDMGGSAARDQFAAKVLVRYSSAVWRMFVGTNPIPRAPKHNGRGYVILGDQDYKVQLVYMTSEEARELAFAGIQEFDASSPLASNVHRIDTARVPRDDQGHVQDTVQDNVHQNSPAETPEVSTPTLSKADICDRLGMTEAAFTKWSQRKKKEGVFPAPEYQNGRPFWTADQLDEMILLRQSA